MVKILELFGGIGACTTALKRLGVEFEIADYVEIDKYAVKSYNAINGTNFEPQDITTWDKNIDVDLIMHGSPCQDISVAGQQAGADEGSGTRSSLMYETIRIVHNSKPKYVIWENVKNLLSKKHKHNFDNYISIMSEEGYNSYYQVLNAKDYGIPQNRERVFTISIRKDIDMGYEFPEKEPLQLRLKDMLEQTVDEKYYLNDAQVERIKTTSYVSGGEKARIQGEEICNTLCVRDFKDPKCVRLGGIFDKENEKHQAGSIYDKEGIAPTLDIMQGGYRQPSIVEDTNPKLQQIIGSKKQGYRVYDSNGIATTQNANGGGYAGNSGLYLVDKEENFVENEIKKIEIPQIVKVRKYPVETELLKTTLRNAKLNVDLNNKEIAEKLEIPQTQVEHYFRSDNSFAIPNPEIWNKLKELLKIETNYFDKSIMTFEEKEGVYEKANRFYLDNGVSPTLNTSNDIKIIPEETFVENKYEEFIKEKGYVPEMFNPYNKTEIQELAPTQTSCCGSNTSSSTVLVKNEEKEEKNLRIRKLTPKECWRLMGFNDEEFEKAEKVNSNSQLYKQAGNSIVVNVLEKILKNLLKGETNE